jgi:predicted RND superfamily exporter protein
MRQEESVNQGQREEEVGHVRLVRVLDSHEARTVGVIDNGAADGAAETSSRFLAKLVVPLVGVVLIAVLITQMRDVSTTLALVLLVAQAALVIFGVIVWLHKPRA